MTKYEFLSLSLQFMASGQCGLPGVSVQYRVERVSSLGTGSVPVPSALTVACHVWALTERTKCASPRHVTVSLFCLHLNRLTLCRYLNGLTFYMACI